MLEKIVTLNVGFHSLSQISLMKKDHKKFSLENNYLYHTINIFQLLFYVKLVKTMFVKNNVCKHIFIAINLIYLLQIEYRIE